MARVVVLGSYAPSLINFRGHLIGELCAAGHEVIAAAPAAQSEGIGEKIAALGARFETVDLRNAGLNPIEEWRSLRRLTEWLEALQPQALLSYTIKPVIWGSLAADRAGVANIGSIITGLGYTFLGETLKQRIVGRIGRALYRRALAHNRRVIFQNPDDRELFIREGLVTRQKTALVNGSGVDIDRYAPPADQVSDSTPVFLMCARLLRDKGVREYLEAARQLKQRHPHATFRLLGPWWDGPTAIRPDELEPFTRDGVVEYLGAADDVRPHFAAANVYVLPSYREGTPRTVLEAMAMARPIVTTDVPGCRETVREGENGYLVTARDPAALAAGMERFIKTPSLISDLGRASRRLVEERYDVRKVTAAILDYLDLSA